MHVCPLTTPPLNYRFTKLQLRTRHCSKFHKHNHTLHQTVIICTDRSPTGNFNRFIKSLDKILNHLTKPNTEFIIRGDINVDYNHVKSSKRQELDILLATCNLISTTDYPTRCTYRSNTAIDNIFIDSTHEDAYSTFPITNGLFDHDGQLIQFHNPMTQTDHRVTRCIRNFNDNNIQDFNTKLSFETWENVFDDNEGTDINRIFNNFHNTFFRIFYASFPEKTIHSQKKHSSWMTKVLKNSITHKRDLYLRCRKSKDQRLKDRYKIYCRILSKINSTSQAPTIQQTNLKLQQ